MMMAKDMGEPMRRATLSELTAIARSSDPLPVMQETDRVVVVRMRSAFAWAVDADLVTPAGLQALDAMQVGALVLRFMQARAAAPESCGPDIIAAPARGPMVAFTPCGVMPKGRDGWEVQHTGWRGRDAARVATAFDRMEQQAQRVSGADYVPLFKPAQVQTAARYAMLVERHNAAGMRCSSVEAMPQGGGASGGSFIDSVIYEGDIIRAMLRAIGDGTALEVRRVRPSQRGTRYGIRDRDLVDAVCLGGKSLNEVLRAHGWSRQGGNIQAARAALCGALDRMSMVFAPRR